MKKIALIALSAVIFPLIALSQPCLPEGIEFTTQAQIDSFQINHPNCTEIEGDVKIGEWGSDINNLNGLSVITSIGGDLDIGYNHSLTSLMGLYNVTSIGGDLDIWGNDVLSSLTGLDNVTCIGGYLAIWNHEALTSLTGLDNINSVEGIYIFGNASLSNCEVQIVCEYLASPGGTINIGDNDIGCNSPEEVEVACNVNPHWEWQNSTVFDDLSSVQFLDEDKGWAAGENGKVVSTDNGGATWYIDGSYNSSYPYHVWFTSVCFKDNNEGIIAGSATYWLDPYWSTKFTIKTSDGGDTWDYNPPSMFYNYDGGWADVCYVDDVGWKLHVKGEIFKSLGNLFGWTVNAIFPCKVRAMHFTDANFGWVSGDEGHLFKTTNGGNDWTQVPTNTDVRLRDVYFINSTMGFISGWWGSESPFLKTIDGGQIWYVPNYPESDKSRILCVKFVNSNVGWACGSIDYDGEDKGLILYTDDAGENWAKQLVTALPAHFNDMFFISESTGWVVGGNGDIYKTTNAGGASSGIEDNNFLLMSNNSPNPFSTFTTLSYTLDKPENVQFTVYNVQGQNVYIMQENQEKGQQKLQWNAEGLPAGMYYFRIQAGNKVVGGKMVKME